MWPKKKADFNRSFALGGRENDARSHAAFFR
jgi:hypothetical protein